jgi:pimeloyl-ACP methyl ester carboxylesterase
MMRTKTALAYIAVIFFLWLFWPAATLDPARHAPGEFIKLRDDTIHYEEAGSSQTEYPLLLLHGFAASSFSWRNNLTVLSAEYRVLAPDGLGFGFSDKNAHRDYSATAEVERIKEFMDAMGIGKAVLAGSSMGGRNAALFASTYPERTAGLILINSAGAENTMEGRGGFIFRIPGLANAFMRIGTSRPVIRALLGSIYYDKSRVTDEVVTGYRTPLVVRGTPAMLKALSAVGEAPELAPLLPELTVPTLVIWGEHDPLFPLEQADFFMKIPGAKLVVVPQAGHLPHEEQSDMVNHQILEFLHTLE